MFILSVYTIQRIFQMLKNTPYTKHIHLWHLWNRYLIFRLLVTYFFLQGEWVNCIFKYSFWQAIIVIKFRRDYYLANFSILFEQNMRFKRCFKHFLSWKTHCPFWEQTRIKSKSKVSAKPSESECIQRQFEPCLTFFPFLKSWVLEPVS